MSSEQQKVSDIGKNNDGSGDQQKPEKKEKKPKEMSDSRVKKFNKLFGQQLNTDEKLINYFSCALVADILLQGHLYISENFFSFYSNVFGYVTRLVIPVVTVSQITREKTAKMFPNAIGISLNSGDGKHVFGSFLSREVAYQLMCSIHKKSQPIEEPEADGSLEDDVDGVQAQTQDIDASESLEDSSSISGSESGQGQFKIAPVIKISEEFEEIKISTPLIPTKATVEQDKANSKSDVSRASKYNFKLRSEFNLLNVGIVLTILLAVFSGLLLLKINAIESHQPSVILDFANTKISFEEAENILNKNLLIVRSVRKKLEDLHMMLEVEASEKMHVMQDKQEF